MKTKAQAKSRPKAARDDLADKLAIAGWVEADDALAQALAAMSQLTAEIARLDQTAEQVHALSARALLVRQLIDAAGRARGLSAFGEVGALAAYDSALHNTLRDAPAPKRVRVLAQGVARGAGLNRVVLVKAISEPVETSRKVTSTSKQPSKAKRHG